MTIVTYECTKANGEQITTKSLAEAKSVVAEGGDYKIKYVNVGDKS